MGGFLKALLLLLVLGLAAGAWLWSDMQTQLHAPLPLSEAQRVEVASGTTLIALLDDLHARGVLVDARLPWYLRLQARLTGQTASLKAGEYRVTPGMSAQAMLAMFMAGRTMMHELRIVEGWTFGQALLALREQEALRHTLGEATPEAAMTALGHAGKHPEGRLFPDTYHFARGTTDLTVLRQAFEAMERALQEEWAGRAPGLPYATPEEALIMASIVEKETGLASERAEIAGVFVRRLQLGMRLQTDPTVIYGLGEKFDGNLRRADLLADGPYNSYTRSGLPPTPICLPGRAAIHAALHPASGKALFFVSRGDGSHQFSETLDEHEAAVQKYQLKKKR